MATPADYINYVCSQINGDYNVRYRKMFGEYMVYINNKPLLLICDSTVYIKVRDEIKDIMKDSDRGVPYDGAKEHYILDIDDIELTNGVIDILEPITKVPKAKKSKIKF